MANESQQQGGPAMSLHRDNSRFKFFYDNGKPELPEDCEGTLSIVPILHLIRTRQPIAE